MVNAGILGMGRWGQLLHDASHACKGLKVVGTASRTPDKLVDYCKDHQLQLYPDFNAMLSDPILDAIIIATPHTTHFDQLMRCAEAGKHVYCEKPFTLKSAQSRQCLGAFADRNLKVAIGHNRRFAPNSLEMFKRLQQGWFGRLQHIDGVFNAPMNSARGRWRDSVEESPAGGMTSLGIHVIDHFVHIMGEVESLRAESRKINGQCAFDDHTTVDFRFSSGAGGHLRTLTNTAMQWQITLYGENGWMQLNDLNAYRCQSVAGDEEQHTFPGYEYPGLSTITAALDAFALDIKDEEPFPVDTAEIQLATQILETIVNADNGWQPLVD